MDKEDIYRIIQDAIKHNSETTNVEFKRGRDGLSKSVWKSVSAFSHKPGGGVIVFGIHDDRQQKKISIEGACDLALLQEKMSDLLSNEMSSIIRGDYHFLELEEKSLLAVYIPECPDQFKPCYYKPAGIPQGAYVRDGNTDRKITDEEMRRFIENSKKLKYDTSQAKGITLEDLSAEKILNLLIKSGNRVQREASVHDINFELLRNLGLADNFDGIKSPTLAGFLIFAAQRPQNIKEFNRYVVRCVKYKGSNVATDIIDSLDVDGTLDLQIDTIQKFILRNIRKSSTIVGAKRVDRYEYPEKAIREIVANAVIHRDYKITETYSQVNVFEDRIEVFNPGCLPPGVTIQNIKEAQVSRNEIISARLKELDYLEEYGRGIDIVFNMMKEWGLLPPIFKNTTNSFKVILLGDKISGLNERQVCIWERLIESKKITAAKLVALFPSVARPTINADLQKMQKLGLIHPIGESKLRYYEANF